MKLGVCVRVCFYEFRKDRFLQREVKMNNLFPLVSFQTIDLLFFCEPQKERFGRMFMFLISAQ